MSSIIVNTPQFAFQPSVGFRARPISSKEAQRP